jgi:hypothetical protein
MTRINLLPPTMLTNIHLMAEYRELPRLFTRVKWRINKGQSLADIQHKISEHYTLNTGHETFFNDKLRWLYNRYQTIYVELVNRGYKIDLGKYAAICGSAIDLRGTEWWGDYTPRPEDVYLNMARVARRSKLDNVLDELWSDV